MTLVPAARAGALALNKGSIRTVPVNHSAGPLLDGCEPLLLISIFYLPLFDACIFDFDASAMILPSLLLFRFPDKDVINDSVPGIVNANEKQQQCCRGGKEKGWALMSEPRLPIQPALRRLRAGAKHGTMAIVLSFGDCCHGWFLALGSETSATGHLFQPFGIPGSLHGDP